MKHLLFALALSCFAQTSTPGFVAPDGPVVTHNLIPVAQMAKLGVPKPPGTTDHIQVRVTNLDPATVKVTIFVTYFDGNDEVKIERTVSRNEVGAVGIFPVGDASKITGIDAYAEELGKL